VSLVKRAAVLLLACSSALLAASCGDDAAVGGDPGGAGLSVVAPTPVVADLARNAAAGDVSVRAMLAPNTDPHDYEVRPADVEALADADLIVRSGGEVDEWLDEAIEGAGTDAPVISLIDHVDPLVGGALVPGEQDEGGAESSDQVDPHWWHDPANAALAVRAIGEALAKAQPEAGHDAAADEYAARLESFSGQIAECVGMIPRGARKLVTTHDALGYYASRFGFEVVGAVIPSLSTEGQASAGGTADLVETIKRERVPAIFAEQSVSADVERAIAEEAGARVGDPLWTDTLGPDGSAAGTYIGAEAANTRAIVEGLTAGRETCTPSP
jgi:ABC-type Zn uptake system ZnuABC Zn-binding protein ZnuA